MEVTKDGQSWQIGTSAEVDWIASATSTGLTITAAIPPAFEAFATFHELDDAASSVAIHEQAVVRHLADRSGDQPWWLGYLDTGAHDIVFDQVPKVSLYTGWNYVLVKAGPEQALTWREGHMRSQHGMLPDLFFPADRSWLISAMWDDAWTCVGGADDLIEFLQHEPQVLARRVALGEAAAPPGRRNL